VFITGQASANNGSISHVLAALLTFISVLAIGGSL